MNGEKKKFEASDDAGEKVVCVNCMKVADSLYTSYSRDVIRITECRHCLKPLDKYIEFDIVLVFIDLILQYLTAYRHLLLNVKFSHYGRLAAIFVLCDAYDKWVERRASELAGCDESPSSIYRLEYQFHQSLLQSIVEAFAYTLAVHALSVALVGRRVANAEKSVRDLARRLVAFRLFTLITLMGFYGNIFVVFSIIWRLHQHWSYRFLTQLFLVISHVQVQRTLLPLVHWTVNCAIVLVGLVAQRTAGYLTRRLVQWATLIFEES